jgi:Zn-dependent protease
MDPKEAIVWYVVFLFSVIFHEAAHAWAAKKGGDLTAYLGGQVSLDPLPHIRREPFGMVILPVIGLFIAGFPIGYASAPYDPIWAFRNHKKAAWMALAGPGANLLILVTGVIIVKVGITSGVFSIPPESHFSRLIISESENGILANLCFFLSVFCSMNLLLVVLNILPLPPFDGSEIISFFLTPSQYFRYKQFINQPLYGFLGIFIAWNLLGPLFRFANSLMKLFLYF